MAVSSRVSVIMLTRDRLDMLKQSVDSVIGSYDRIELVVVDSSTNQEAMSRALNPYHMETEEFCYIYRERGESDPPCILPVCRNIGLDEATGDYVTFHDSKNIQGRDKLSAAVQYLDTHPDVDVVFGNAKHPTGDLQNSKSAQEWLTRGLFKSQYEAKSNYIGINSAVWRRIFGVRLDPLSGTADDFDLALTLSKLRLAYIDVDMYRSPGWHPGSVSARFNYADYIPGILERHRMHYEGVCRAST